MNIKDIWNEALGYMGLRPQSNSPDPIKNPVSKDTRKPAARVTQPEDDDEEIVFSNLEGFVKPPTNPDLIPVIRSLVVNNEDVGIVYNDLITLTNTGHKIVFDQSINPELQDKMRKHLQNRSATWGSGVHGINGLINKWIGQIWVSGALSNEWVVAEDMSGIQTNVLVNPENIKFKYNNKLSRYEPYQKLKYKIFKGVLNNIVKLNTNTYNYIGLLGNTDSPYGIPPFIPVIEPIKTQRTMRKNINHILKQLGLLGYLEVKVSKPTQKENESTTAYEGRLDTLLRDTKKNVIDGFAEGVVTGFEEDHEFEFHSTSKQLNGVADIFNSNELLVANGLKSAATFINQKSNGTETNMSIVFTKLLSQMRNIQEILSSNLKMGYLLELQLAGFVITNADLNIVFSASTITDDLKMQQALEIKQRIAKALFIDGIISKEEYAEICGYTKPYSEEPVIPYDQQEGRGTDQQQKEKDAASKTKSERKTREKDKKQPRRKDSQTKPA